MEHVENFLSKFKYFPCLFHDPQLMTTYTWINQCIQKLSKAFMMMMWWIFQWCKKVFWCVMFERYILNIIIEVNCSCAVILQVYYMLVCQFADLYVSIIDENIFVEYQCTSPNMKRPKCNQLIWNYMRNCCLPLTLVIFATRNHLKHFLVTFVTML